MDRGSQWGEDRWIAEHLSPPSPGVFVEVGGHDGLENSNTIYFEDRGWTGLLVEADIRNLAACRANRNKVQCQLMGVPCGQIGEQLFFMPENSSWSSLQAPKVAVRSARLMVHSLRWLLKWSDIQEIDLLSIDTEGTELDVWESFDPTLHKPKIVVMEYLTNDMPSQEEAIQDRLARDGYLCVHKTNCNLILVRQ